MKNNQLLIRNFAIIAHIDHGKSTLADRFMEITETVKKRDSQEQLLDSHPISRARGITIRLAPVTMNYTLSSLRFTLNLIDTPGHVDFSYEVERSLAACEGAILLVDATQGIQAQTLSHFKKAVNLGLTIIPVINKIDSPNAKVEETLRQLQETSSLEGKTVYKISAKTGEGVSNLLKAIVEKVPSPSGDADKPTRALVFSSQFDPARGVTAFVKIVDGKIESKSKIKFLADNSDAIAFEIGHFTPAMTASQTLETGEVGFVTTSLKNPSLVHVGDTITLATSLQYPVSSLPGYKDPKPVVFVSFFPVDQNDFANLEDSLKKLLLNDAAISFSPTSSKMLGRGFRCGFLGHLHAEVTEERLEKDYQLNIIATLPTVEFKTASDQSLLEPIAKTTILTPSDFVGSIITLCEDRRGKMIDLTYSGQNAILTYELPLSEIITDFFDQLKSKSSGFASLDYEISKYRPFEAVQLDILINHEAIDAFSQTMEKSRAEKFGRFVVERLKEVIPRQQIPISLQASVNGVIMARSDIPAFRKDVTAKLYGGDSTRRMKLLEKQKKGKEKMLALSQSVGKSIGKIQIPSDTFLKIFRT